MKDEVKEKLLEAYPPHLVDRILAFRTRGDELSGRRKSLVAASDDMDGKMWQRAFDQIEMEAREYRSEGEALKEEMEAWINHEETR